MTDATARTAPVPTGAYLHLLVIYLVWGSTYFAVKLCVSGPTALTPLQVQVSRMWLAALLLGAVTLVQAGPPRGLDGRGLTARDIGLCIVTGILMWLGGNGLATLASRHAASGFIVMAMGAIPLWTALIEAVLRRALPDGRTLMALGVGMAGLALICVPALVDGHAHAVEPGYGLITIAILCGGGFSWALGTVLQRPLIGRMAAGWSGSLQMLAAAVALTIPALIEATPVPAIDAVQWGALAFLVIFGSVISLTSYLFVVRTLSPQIASTFAYVNPVVGVLLGWGLLGEQPAAISLAGMAVVLGAIAMMFLRRRNSPGIRSRR